MFESIKIYTGMELAPQVLLKDIVHLDYKPQDKVNQEGDFSHRGGIIDIFPITFTDPIRIEFYANRVESIRSFEVLTGKVIETHKMVIILPKEFFKDRKILQTGLGERIPIDSFVDISVGNYVVHVEHGIGKFCGRQRIKANSRTKDYLVIEYQDKDRLYIPTDEINLIQKYVSFSQRPPKLNRLGTKIWQRQKEKIKRAVSSFAFELLELQAQRLTKTGYSFSRDTDWQAQLEQSFPYEETPDQLKATIEVKQDMESKKAMDRLLCGDVGYGKTEVALRAAFKAVMDNKQVAILVPTTILAEQHYKTFYERMKQFPANIQMLSRFKTQTQQRQILDGLTAGGVDIVIGTHRLLSDDIKFKDLGLVIIDEEQRFGVRHKEKLKKLRLLADVMTLTATPIPRTLYMSLMGARDMSAINTPPPDRLPIKTVVLEWSDAAIKEAIKCELARGGQVYFVNNRIKGIQRLATNISALLPQAKVAIAHGRMPARELEEIMLDFINGKVDILVCTTIIESGIDIPNANTIIVNRADTYGLADLYQLRGRVGRFKKKAYAYFIIPKGYVLAKDARSRLRAIERFGALGSGFKVAMEDLKIRGAGNLLGVQQHGYIATVGFDLYCRLLREAIGLLKQAKWAKI